MVATLVFGQLAVALDDRDPFQIRLGGEGDRIMAGNYMRDWGVDGRDPYYTPYDQARYYDLAQSLFIPPVPPALGEALPGSWDERFRNSLAPDFARETFYGGYVIATNLDKLSPGEAGRIAAYRGARQQLLEEIRVKIAELAGTTAAVRQAGLAGLAARQETRLRALASEEEAIRNELAWVNSVFRIRINLPAGPFRLDQSGRSQQLTILRLGNDRIVTPELPRLFTSAYFHEGLSTEQRLLLTEIAYGQMVGTKLNGESGRVADTPGFFFLPATACIPLPAGLPPALQEKISAFTREKEGLKDELRSAVLRDDYFFVATRTRRLAALAAQQEPRWAALEVLAEEIRVGLAAFGASNQVAYQSLPVDITQRMGRFNVRKVAARRELLNQLRQLRKKHPDESFDIERQGDGLAIVQKQAGAQPVAGLAGFNADQARQYTELAGESDILRREIQGYLDRSPQRGTRTVDQLAGDFAKAYVALESRDSYRDYAHAVLEPGLSPAQRRLLFHSGLTMLEHPAATPQP